MVLHITFWENINISIKAPKTHKSVGGFLTIRETISHCNMKS